MFGKFSEARYFDQNLIIKISYKKIQQLAAFHMQVNEHCSWTFCFILYNIYNYIIYIIIYKNDVLRTSFMKCQS